MLSVVFALAHVYSPLGHHFHLLVDFNSCVDADLLAQPEAYRCPPSLSAGQWCHPSGVAGTQYSQGITHSSHADVMASLFSVMVGYATDVLCVGNVRLNNYGSPAIDFHDMGCRIGCCVTFLSAGHVVGRLQAF